ncbi:protease modulator HflK [Aliagarivorans taiwanensis]|uniref:protease modulator HflK n=1 Tax=Aliagarivorans taiwanensis TaxID=561966 RepID=UPI00041337A3|nr:protease modulator HflK [Aliagarivorans taiwanensis]
MAQVSLKQDLLDTARASRRILLGVCFVLLPLIYLLSGFYSVGVEQRAVVTRFGKITADNVLPGMHYRLPWPFESVQKLRATELRSITVNYAKEARQRYMPPELTTKEGDLVDLAFELQYNIPRPGAFQSSAVDAEALLRQLAVSEALYYVSGHDFESLLTTGRNQFQQHLRQRLQQQSEELALGINLTSVLIRRMEAPRSIKRAFENVQNAPAERRKIIEEAQSRRTTALVEARSKVNSIEVEAHAYASDTLQQAQGDVERFGARLSAYQQAPEQTLQREYIDAVEQIISSSRLKVVPIN